MSDCALMWYCFFFCSGNREKPRTPKLQNKHITTEWSIPIWTMFGICKLRRHQNFAKYLQLPRIAHMCGNNAWLNGAYVAYPSQWKQVEDESGSRMLANHGKPWSPFGHSFDSWGLGPTRQLRNEHFIGSTKLMQLNCASRKRIIVLSCCHLVGSDLDAREIATTGNCLFPNRTKPNPVKPCKTYFE